METERRHAQSTGGELEAWRQGQGYGSEGTSPAKKQVLWLRCRGRPTTHNGFRRRVCGNGQEGWGFGCKKAHHLGLHPHHLRLLHGLRCASEASVILTPQFEFGGWRFGTIGTQKHRSVSFTYHLHSHRLHGLRAITYNHLGGTFWSAWLRNGWGTVV